MTLERAQAILDLRDRSFVACDLDAYLSIWAADCSIEGPTYFIEGRGSLRRTIEAAWSVQTLHTGSTVCGVDASGRWSWLREYFDPADRPRASATELRVVRELLS